MAISERTADDVTVLQLDGRLDAAEALQVKQRVESLIAKKNVRIVFDLGSVTFVDSSGLGSLVACLRSVSKADGDVRIAALKDQVRAVFELTRLHRIFEVFDAADDAVKSFHR